MVRGWWGGPTEQELPRSGSGWCCWPGARAKGLVFPTRGGREPEVCVGLVRTLRCVSTRGCSVWESGGVTGRQVKKIDPWVVLIREIFVVKLLGCSFMQLLFSSHLESLGKYVSVYFGAEDEFSVKPNEFK